MEFEVCRITTPPELTSVLGETARSEGFRMVDTLVKRFHSGANRFDRPGEALFGVKQAGRLVGIGGLNIDPYFGRVRTGRVRHVYVHPDFRGGGMGRHIVRSIEQKAGGTFDRLELFTPNEDASRFYEALGYRRVSGILKVSHTKRIG